MNIKDNIQLNIDAEKIPAKLFKKKVNAFLDLLEEITKLHSKNKKALRWDISVESGSQILNAYPMPLIKENVANRVFNTMDRGISTISAGKAGIDIFPEKVLEDIMELSKPYKNNGASIKGAYININGKIQKLDEKMFNNIEGIIGTTNKAYGSIEGSLEVISKLHGLLSFGVVDVLSNRVIKCLFKDTNLLNKVISSFDKRVSVYGLIYYNRKGEITSIIVESFKVFLENKDLPNSYDMLGIFKN